MSTSTTVLTAWLHSRSGEIRTVIESISEVSIALRSLEDVLADLEEGYREVQGTLQTLSSAENAHARGAEFPAKVQEHFEHLSQEPSIDLLDISICPECLEDHVGECLRIEEIDMEEPVIPPSLLQEQA